MNCALISYRFYLRPGSFTSSFTDRVESLFIPAFVSWSLSLFFRLILANRLYSSSRKFKLALDDSGEHCSPSRIAIIMINICEYGVDYVGVWLLRTLEVMFWVYVALSTFASAGMYLILWSTL